MNERGAHIEVLRLLDLCSADERREVFRQLRREFPIHPLESELQTEAEIVLEAISRAGPLTLRMLRGVIAEAAFAVDVVETLHGWSNVTPPGDLAYDFLLADDQGEVRVQVKLQRCLAFKPMWACDGYRWLPKDMYAVETQRTRRGTRAGSSTRPYRFGEFDILAVSMQPSRGTWHAFMYTVARWLIPARDNPNELLKFQPITLEPSADWTDDFETAVEWLRSGIEKTIKSS
jgi:hypothetical protein